VHVCSAGDEVQHLMHTIQMLYLGTICLSV
jgi:hypothetical protein